MHFECFFFIYVTDITENEKNNIQEDSYIYWYNIFSEME